MTREEAIKLVCYGDWLNILILHLGDDDINRLAEAMYIIGDTLRPVSREKVEKVFPGCPKCRYEDGKEPMEIYYPDEWDNGIGFEYGKAIFCPECGRPLTDEAVEMVMERMEELHDTSN